MLEKFHLERCHSAATRAAYRQAFSRWQRFGLGEISTDSLAQYIHQRAGDGVASDTVLGEARKLAAYARWMGVTLRVTMPRPVQRAPQSWSRSQCRILWREALRTKRTIFRLPGCVYWPALLGVAYDTGERIGAIMSLEWSDLSELVVFRAETRKGRVRDMVLPLSPSTLRSLARLRRHERSRPFLLGDRTTVWLAYTRLLKDAGLPTDRRSKFHRIRRTVATECHLAGGDATALLGHSSDAVTRRSYLDPLRMAARNWWRPWAWW